MRKRPPEPVNHERWLVSYADLLTLLFALFVVLYAMSQADAARFKQVAESMKRAFAGQPSLPSTKMGGTGSSPFPADNLGFPGDPMAERVAPAGTSPDQGLAVGAPAGASRNRQNLKDLNELQARIAESMSQELSTADLSDQMQTVVNHQGLVVRLAAADFFDDGQSAVRPELRPILDRIGRVLLKSDRQVRIEGTPIWPKKRGWESSQVAGSFRAPGRPGSCATGWSIWGWIPGALARLGIRIIAPCPKKRMNGIEAKIVG